MNMLMNISHITSCGDVKTLKFGVTESAMNVPGMSFAYTCFF